jgi:hypothetical protein
MEGKFREWDVDLAEEETQEIEEPMEWQSLETSEQDIAQDDADTDDYDPHEDEDFDGIADVDLGPNDYHFIPHEIDSGNVDDEAGAAERPGRPHPSVQNMAQAERHVLDDDQDERIIIVEKEAGQVHRMESPPHFHARASEIDPEGDINMTETSNNSFHPFNSELDWRVAQWAIKDNPGHKAFDRLLSIPGVRHQMLNPRLFSYHF